MKPVDKLERNKYYHCLEYDHDQTGNLCLISCGVEQCERGVQYFSGIKDCYSLHAVLGGTGTLRVSGQILHPCANQLFLIRPDEVVEYTADESDPWRYSWVDFLGDEAKEMCEHIGFTEGVYCLDSEVDVSEFYSLIYRMHERPAMNYINDLRRRGILFEFLALAMEATGNTEHSMQKVRCSPDVYVRRAAEFMRYNFASVTVNDVVEYVGFSRSYFSSLFKELMGISMQEFLMECRISRSRELLEKTDLPIGEIALRVGYDNPMNFSRAFKGCCGLSPVHYRQCTKQEET